MFTSKQEKERCVIDLYSQGKTYRQIAEEARISPNDIHAILKKKEEEQNNSITVTNNQQQQSSFATKAYGLFLKGKTPLQVSIELNIRQSLATKYYKEYWKLKRLYVLNFIYKETNGKLRPFLKLYKQLIKQRGMSIEQIVNVIDIAIHKLPHMETLYRQARDEMEKMQRTLQRLVNDIRALEHKISILDKIAFSSEHECNRNVQQVQALAAKKDRLEKWIAKVSNNDALKQMVKEYVKAALSENKQLISVAFTALLQTLTSDPQLINIIYKILTSNDREQHKDNSNDNVTKYLESNKDIILDLAEKHFDNLVEGLTNNALNTATASPSPTLTLSPPSSSGFPNLSNQSHKYGIEESEIYYNSRGDIAD